MRNQRTLSTWNRQTSFVEISGTKQDLLIIGGGITGAGIALDAASRGLKCALVEKQDFAAGTSSRSTKLIHGGLRYLKQGELKLVREVGRERAILHRNAPHIVIPEKMLLPLLTGGSIGRITGSAALYLYDLLAGVKKEEIRKVLNKAETEKAEPLLRQDILRGGVLYFEYRTDDARLTIEVLKTAASYGAICLNYAEAETFIYMNGRIAGVRVRDQLSGKIYDVYADKIVNAAGPWVDHLREKDRSLFGKRLHLTKGVHLVVPHHRFPLRQSVYFDTPDGRMIFAIPRMNCTYIGTTDTNYDGLLEDPPVTEKDVLYLLSAVNHLFPSVELCQADIISSWAGLRPLIHEEGKSPSELSRKDEIFLSHSGLISIAGGKLTGYRRMAERVTDAVMEQLGKEKGISFKPCVTERITLSGGNLQNFNLGGSEDFADFITQMTEKLWHTQIEKLASMYGSNIEKIIALAEKIPDVEDARLKLLLAELRYGIEEEMVTNLSDFLIRRTGRLYFERDEISGIYPLLHEELSGLLEWTFEEATALREQFEIEYWGAVGFR